MQSKNIVLLQHPQLSLTADSMGASLATLSIGGPFIDQIATATGIVSSARPSVEARLVVSLLPSHNVESIWCAQAQRQRDIGTVIMYPDSGHPVTLEDCFILDIDRNAYDGSKSATKLTITGSLRNGVLERV